MGGLTEEISIMRYDQTEDRRTQSQKLTGKSWSQRKKENAVSTVLLRQTRERDSRKSQREGKKGLRHQLA